MISIDAKEINEEEDLGDIISEAVIAEMLDQADIGVEVENVPSEFHGTRLHTQQAMVELRNWVRVTVKVSGSKEIDYPRRIVKEISVCEKENGPSFDAILVAKLGREVIEGDITTLTYDVEVE